MNKVLFYLFAAVVISVGFAACVDQDFDEPPVSDLPDKPLPEVNTTIAELKALHTIGSDDRLVEDDLVISGVVTADDESGNLYKQIVIEDETAGIILRLNSIGIYNNYPVGRRLYVKCKGLYIGDYNGLIQINGSPDEPIEELLIPEYIVTGGLELPVVPTKATIDGLTNALTGRLIQLDDVQFAAADVGGTYANAVNQLSLNRTLEDCNGNSIIVRTSGFADFAGVETPAGNGTLVAVLTIFGNTRQLVLRDLDDVNLTGERCQGGTGGELITIKEIRDLFHGGSDTGPDNKKIRGVVISDKDGGNINGQNLVLQDASAGILVRFQGSHNFSLGDEIEVGVGGQELSEYNGLLQVNQVPAANANLIGPGALPTPRTVTVQELLDNGEAWESSLVTIEGATISGGATFAGSATVSDGTGSIPLFTYNSANFADQPLPAGEVSLTAIVGDYNGLQLNLRNINDVDVTGNGGDPTLIDMAELRELYENGASAAPAGRKIRGVVISDKDNENITGRNIVIQDGSGGLVVRFTGNHDFALGEELEIVVSGQELSEYNGLFQVNNVSNSNAVSFGNGTLPEPRTATISEIVEKLEEWESTLVRIENATISGGTSFGGSLNVSDGTGTIVLYTRSQATFANASVPAGTVTMIGLVSQFNDPQINIRNLNDINP